MLGEINQAPRAHTVEVYLHKKMPQKGKSTEKEHRLVVAEGLGGWRDVSVKPNDLLKEGNADVLGFGTTIIIKVIEFFKHTRNHGSSS